MLVTKSKGQPDRVDVIFHVSATRSLFRKNLSSINLNS